MVNRRDQQPTSPPPTASNDDGGVDSPGLGRFHEHYWAPAWPGYLPCPTEHDKRKPVPWTLLAQAHNDGTRLDTLRNWIHLTYWRTLTLAEVSRHLETAGGLKRLPPAWWFLEYELARMIDATGGTPAAIAS